MKKNPNALVLVVCLLAVSCASGPVKPAAPVVGETSGSLSRLRLETQEIKTLESGAAAFFKANAGSLAEHRDRTAPNGSLMTPGNYYFSDYRLTSEPRTMRGVKEELAILPYAALANFSSGSAAFSSYLLATRPKGGGRWKYAEGTSLDEQALDRRFPGLKETNAIPQLKIGLADAHPALRKGW